MIELSQIFAVATEVAVALGLVAVWAPRRPLVKFAATGLVLAFVPLAYAALAELLGRPKPVVLEWWTARVEEATVLGAVMQEGRGIYFWLQLPEFEEPRSYVLPWSRELAEQLQKALAAAKQNDTEVRMRLPFEPSWDDREPKFYALPQPALPPKNVPGSPLWVPPAPGKDA